MCDGYGLVGKVVLLLARLCELTPGLLLYQIKVKVQVKVHVKVQVKVQVNILKMKAHFETESTF
mgnify:CR=1 FL=1